MNAIYHNFIIKVSPEKVYRAISTPSDLENWWPLKCSGKPAFEELYNFNFTDEYNWYGKVVKAENAKAFYIKMTEADADWSPTTFGFDLEKTSEGYTYVEFWHKDWPALNRHLKYSSFCWASLLKDLRNYLERGTVVPFEDRE
ncbi:SRPBCC domain-containing protein [uncultured Arcticibacterium sp.]|uniref:SRPBCC domain-containing protein n=1 Tax=uncultured Arcticibacterium sp. TaxID=2173042 RepID=UPI0030FACF69